MIDNYNEVYTQNSNNNEYNEENVEYVYLTIPAEYVCVYHKLLIYMADFGKQLLDDCTASCKGSGKTVINCWNIFQSALACHTLGRTKEADFFIDYIKQQLENVYKGSDKTVYNNSVPLPISEDGKLKAIVSCGTDVKFYVDPDTGKLFKTYLDSKNDGRVYTIDNNNLNVSSD